MTETLGGLIKRRMGELGITYAEVAVRSEGAITSGMANALVSGQQRSTKPPVVRALARALEVPLEEVVTANAAGRSPFELPAEAHLLSPRSRKAVLALIEALWAAERSHG